MALQLIWNDCRGNEWCPLMTVDLEHEHFNNMEGVYIIWHGGQNSATVRVGQGAMRDRIAAHREDQEVLAYQHLTLYVTWASVSASQRNGVERFLAERLKPKIGSRYPQIQPIQVNLPW